MKVAKSIKIFFYDKIAAVIRKLHLYNLTILRDDERPDCPFKVVFFCGKSQIEYLNASLFSIYHFWKYLPKIYIISDGTPVHIIKQKLIKWPREVKIITWEDAALYYKSKGNVKLYNIASTKRWPGRKFVSLLFLAENFSLLYSDTDVLWFSTPKEMHYPTQPFIKMGKEPTPFYTPFVLSKLSEEQLLNDTSFNSGVMYLSGKFSSYPKWEKMCEILETNPDDDNFAEQTAFAVLNNYFNKEGYLSKSEALMKSEDRYSLKYTKKCLPETVARHYAGIKNVTFWRDFLYMYLERPKNNIQ